MVRIEMHAHTRYAASCSELDAKTLVTGCLRAGCSGLVVTDHFHRNTKWFCFSEEKSLKIFLIGYERVREEGVKRGLAVYRGAELRFDEGHNDYLLYGFSDALLSDPEAVFSMGLQRFSALARQDGAVLVQAHPYRTSEGCAPVDPMLLDGVEVFNGNPVAPNHNERAYAFALQHPALLRICGSDCHHPNEIGQAGILTDALPANDTELVRLLKRKAFIEEPHPKER